jgi:hypothetical protein
MCVMHRVTHAQIDRISSGVAALEARVRTTQQPDELVALGKRLQSCKAPIASALSLVPRFQLSVPPAMPSTLSKGAFAD